VPISMRLNTTLSLHGQKKARLTIIRPTQIIDKEKQHTTVGFAQVGLMNIAHQHL